MFFIKEKAEKKGRLNYNDKKLKEKAEKKIKNQIFYFLFFLLSKISEIIREKKRILIKIISEAVEEI